MMPLGFKKEAAGDSGRSINSRSAETRISPPISTYRMAGAPMPMDPIPNLT